jgi:hypothetical protein
MHAHGRPRRELLPYREQLSSDDQVRWVRRWRRLSWLRSRYVILRVTIFAAVLAILFYFHVADGVLFLAHRWCLTVWYLLMAVVISKAVVEALSRREIAACIAEELATRRPNQAMQPTADPRTASLCDD